MNDITTNRLKYIQVTRVWQKWRFSASKTHLRLIKIWFYASTFVVKIATFAKPETVSGNAMVTHPANKKLNKTEFNNLEDWDTYPTADYCCDKCNQTVSLNFDNLTKHQFSTFSNFKYRDKKAIDLFALTNKLEPTNSLLDFYCPTCKRPVRIYYDSWAGARQGEQGFSIKYIVD